MTTNKRAGGQPGNQNAAHGYRWRRKLMEVLETYQDPENNVKPGEALAAIATTVIKLAIAGDKDAYQEIGNRLDGKAKEHIDITAEIAKRARDLTDDELAAIVTTRGGAGVASEAGSESDPSRVH